MGLGTVAACSNVFPLAGDDRPFPLDEARAIALARRSVCGPPNSPTDAACSVRNVRRTGRAFEVVIARGPAASGGTASDVVRVSVRNGGMQVEVEPVIVSGAAAGALRSAGGSDASSCVAALDSLQAVFRRDYPGYRDRLAGREAAFAALTDSVRAVAATSDDHAVCIPALWRWTGFFRDPHVMLWQASPPPPGAASGQSSAPPANDPLRPSLRFVDDSTAVLRLPTFDMAYKPAIDSLVADNRAALLTRPYLIVDVRGNGGGYTGSFSTVLPLLADGPIHRFGVDLWTSAANVDYLRGYLTSPGTPDAFRAQIARVLPEMEARPNEFVPFAPSETVTFVAQHPFPRAVAVLLDRRCASSCENFVLDARQSRRVVTMGTENTRGSIDYGNVRSVWLPGWRRLRVPTSRSRNLPAEPLNEVGIAPAVRIPEGIGDAIAFAQQYLQASIQALRGKQAVLQALPTEQQLVGGALRIVNLYRQQALALGEGSRQSGEETVSRLVHEVYRPYREFWEGYLGDESSFRAWAHSELLAPEHPIRSRLDALLRLNVSELFEQSAAWLMAETGRRPEGTWYLAFGPGWTDMGGLGRIGMVVDFTKMMPDSLAFRNLLPHELAHQVHGASPSRRNDPDAGTVLERIVSEGLASYAAYVFGNGEISPASALLYTEEAYARALAQEAALMRAAEPLLSSRDRTDINRLASRSETLLDGGPTAAGYFLGFRIVQAYVAVHGPASWTALFDLPVREVLRQSGYRW